MKKIFDEKADSEVTINLMRSNNNSNSTATTIIIISSSSSRVQCLLNIVIKFIFVVAATVF